MEIAQQEIEEANALAREGNSQAAIALLSKLIQQDSSNVDAWLALADVVDEPERVEFCLQKVLSLDPGNEAALERLSKDKGGSLSVGSVASAPAPDASAQVAADPADVEPIENSMSPETPMQLEESEPELEVESEDSFQPEPDLEAASVSEPEHLASEMPAQAKAAEPQADVAPAGSVQAQPTEGRSRMGRTDLILIGLTVLAGIVLCALVSVALLT